MRQTVYDVIGKMLDKGLVSSTIYGKRKMYSAAEPQAILNKLKEQEEDFFEVMPELEKIKLSSSMTLTSQTFIGISGVKNLILRTIESKSEILWLDNMTTDERAFQKHFWLNLAKKRFEKRIPLKLLIEPTKATRWNTNLKILRETRKSELVKGLDGSFVIFDDKVIVYSVRGDDYFGVYIQNKAIKEMLQKMFHYIWKEADTNRP